MPALILVLLILMVATFGFFDTLKAIMGGVLVFVLLIVLAGGLIAAVASYFWRRAKR